MANGPGGARLVPALPPAQGVKNGLFSGLQILYQRSRFQARVLLLNKIISGTEIKPCGER
jgi:hypothetical protein